MDEQLRVTYEDDVLADPVPGATWNFGESEASGHTVLPHEEAKEPVYDKRAEVTKILMVVAVGTLGGILGGITLAKYAIRSTPAPDSTAGKAAVVASVATPSSPPPAVTAGNPQQQASASAPIAEVQPSTPALVATSAVQPVKAPAPPTVDSAQQVLGVYAQNKDAATEVIVFLAAPAEVSPQKLGNPNRLFFDLPNANVTSSALEPVSRVSDGLLRRVRTGRSESGATRVVFDVKSEFKYEYSVSKEAPYRLTIRLLPG